jgi:hypothetical protein
MGHRGFIHKESSSHGRSNTASPGVRTPTIQATHSPRQPAWPVTHSSTQPSGINTFMKPMKRKASRKMGVTWTAVVPDARKPYARRPCQAAMTSVTTGAAMKGIVVSFTAGLRAGSG